MKETSDSKQKSESFPCMLQLDKGITKLLLDHRQLKNEEFSICPAEVLKGFLNQKGQFSIEALLFILEFNYIAW